MRLSTGLYFLCLSLGGASLAMLVAAAPPAIASAADPAAPRDPQAVWDKLCKSCHGADGKGNPEKAKTLKIDVAKLDLGREESKAMTREEKKAQLLDGKDKMPAYKTKVKPDEVDPLLDLVEKITEEARKPAP